MNDAFEPYDFGENRDVINKILVAALNHYGYPFDVAAGGREEHKIVDPLYMFQHAPGLVPLFTIAALVKKEKLTDKEAGWMGRFTDGLLDILIRAHSGDEDAANQLKAIDKLIYPDTYELPKTVVDNLIKQYHTRAPLARGWRLREIIGGLSSVVEPVSQSANVLNGAIRLKDTAKDKGSTIYSEVAKSRVSAYDAAKRHWKRGVTLKTLAIRVYLEDLQQQGFEGIDERTLKRDLKEVEAWEKTLPEEQRKWGVVVHTSGSPLHLPVGKYSEGWKQRKRSRTSTDNQDKN